MKFLSVFAAGFAALGGLLSFTGGAHAGAHPVTIFNVACNFTDIQDAADVADPGDIIQIAAGTCSGPTILIARPGITIEGAGPSSTILIPLAVIVFQLEADDVTFKDMTIRTFILVGSIGIRLFLNGGTIDNTEINNVEFGTSDGIQILGTTTVTDLRVIDSHFRGTGIGNGILAAPTSTVDGLTITNSTFDDYAVALQLGFGGSTPFLKNLHISRSTFKNNGTAITAVDISDSFVEHSTFFGNEFDIFLARFSGSSGFLADNVVIRDNVLMNTVNASIFLVAFSGTSGIGAGGITIENNTFNQAVGVMSDNFGKIDVQLSPGFDHGPVEIRNNNISFFGTFSGSAGATAAYGIKLSGSLDNISIQGNQIDGGGVADGGGQPPLSGIFINTNHATFGPAQAGDQLFVNACNTVTGFVNGVSLYDSTNAAFGGLPLGVEVVIDNNNIAGNSGYGVNNGGTSETIDATGNWWGAASGPGGIANAITANVDFEPFLVEPCAGGSNNFLPNHFLLYDLVTAPEEPALSPLNIPVEISDQFDNFRGGPLDKIVGRPIFLANPVSTSEEDVADPSEHLVCYLIGRGGDGPVDVDVLFSNQFTEEDVGRVKTARLLCVPSTKTVLE